MMKRSLLSLFVVAGLACPSAHAAEPSTAKVKDGILKIVEGGQEMLEKVSGAALTWAGGALAWTKDSAASAHERFNNWKDGEGVIKPAWKEHVAPVIKTITSKETYTEAVGVITKGDSYREVAKNLVSADTYKTLWAEHKPALAAVLTVTTVTIAGGLYVYNKWFKTAKKQK